MGPNEPATIALDADLAGVLDDALKSIGLNGRQLASGVLEGGSLARALGLPQSATDFLYARACRWFSLGQPKRAEPLFRALCLLHDTDADFWIAFGVCLRLRSAFDEALSAFTTAAALRPDWPVPNFHLLELLVRREQWDRAADQLTKFAGKVDGTVERAMVVEAARYAAAIKMHNTAWPRHKLPVGDGKDARP
jgi:Flp pilus assembly protein TadD